MSDSLEDFKRDSARAVKDSHEAFTGVFKEELNELAGLSRAEIDEILPGTTDLETYAALMEVVKAASRNNVAAAALKARIEDLGDVAVTIAKKIPRFAALFA